MILLVTGARCLADTPAAERWARERIAAAFEQHHPTLVVTGDARGPDAWALELARGVRPAESWSALGAVYTYSARGEPSTAWFWKPDGTHDPLARNRAMVAHVAATYRPQGVRVLALLAGWSRTHGTHMTLGLARRAGLAVEEHVCPAELGPRGERR